MTTDLALTHASGDLTAAPGSTGGDIIREAAAVWADAYKLSRAVCGTSIVPVHFRGKPEECAAAMVYGASLGLDPIGALRGLYNVHGSVAMYAQLAVSIVMRDGHELWVVSSTDDAVTVAGRRKGWPEDRTFMTTWDYDRARRAGYTGNKKYDSDPQAMLTAKAQMETCRRIAPDSLNGIYSVEELELEPRTASGSKTSGPAREASAATFTSIAAHQKEEQPAKEPAAESTGMADEATGDVTDDTPAPPTPAELDGMFSAFNVVFDSDARTSDGKRSRLAYMAGVLNRPVESTRDLTCDDVARVTAALRERGAATDDGAEAGQ